MTPEGIGRLETGFQGPLSDLGPWLVVSNI